MIISATNVFADGLEKLKAIYGITKYGIGNENAVYTATF